MNLSPDILGITLSLIAAVGQALGFLLSRQYVVNHKRSALSLLVVSHLWIGLACLIILPLFWNDNANHPSTYLIPTIGSAASYCIGQFFMFTALRWADASRVSPLLGLKIATVAVITTITLKTQISPYQWVAVAIAAAAAYMLNRTGGKLPPKVVIAMILTCISYSFADVFIVKSFEALGPPEQLITTADRFNAIALAFCLYYITCAAFCLALLPWHGSKSKTHWTASLNYSFVWIVSTFALFSSIALAGPILANIGLATRGLFSIILGALIAKLGHHHLEQHTTLPILVRRAIAAILMIAAIALYQYASPTTPPTQ